MPHALSCDKRIFVVYTIQRTFNAVVFSGGQNFKDEVFERSCVRGSRRGWLGTSSKARQDLPEFYNRRNFEDLSAPSVKTNQKN